ncbi:hypothetical protein KCP70_20230 [Salmonella enterica subsp. enterica]|nr:hypothetical protein KCP70_20230 [Salmonella enterica subsp. enterica]
MASHIRQRFYATRPPPAAPGTPALRFTPRRRQIPLTRSAASFRGKVSLRVTV